MVLFAHHSVGQGFGRVHLDASSASHAIIWLSHMAGKFQEGLSTWLVGLPHIMVVGFQEGAFQVTKTEAIDLLGSSFKATQCQYCHILLVKQARVIESALTYEEGK